MQRILALFLSVATCFTAATITSSTSCRYDYTRHIPSRKTRLQIAAFGTGLAAGATHKYIKKAMNLRSSILSGMLTLGTNLLFHNIVQNKFPIMQRVHYATSLQLAGCTVFQKSPMLAIITFFFWCNDAICAEKQNSRDYCTTSTENADLYISNDKSKSILQLTPAQSSIQDSFACAIKTKMNNDLANSFTQAHLSTFPASQYKILGTTTSEDQSTIRATHIFKKNENIAAWLLNNPNEYLTLWKQCNETPPHLLRPKTTPATRTQPKPRRTRSSRPDSN